MIQTPKVSVILTSYNHAKYLPEAIESVLGQTFSDFELIIADDASTDESWSIIQSYADTRIKAFRTETSTKAGGDLRRVISDIARGDTIAIHHSDDVWEPHKLEKQVTFLEDNPQVGAVFSQASIIGEEGEPFENSLHVYSYIFNQPNRSRYEWLNHFFYHGNALCHPSAVVRKKCYADCGVYRYGLAHTADFDMWVRLCLKYDIYVLPEKLVRFRVRANEMNASGNFPEARSRRPFERLQILEHYRKIATAEDFIAVFPAAEKYKTPEGIDLDFALGRLALEDQPPQFKALFGLTILFEALNEPLKAKEFKALYHFDNSDLVALTAKQDVFSIGLIESLRAQIAAQERSPQADAFRGLNAETEQLRIELNQANGKAALLESRLESLRQELQEARTLAETTAAELADLRRSRFYRAAAFYWRWRHKLQAAVLGQSAGRRK